NRKFPAARSRTEANTLGLSGRGTHIHSTLPLGAIRQLASQSERNAYSAMGGKELAISIGAGPATGSISGAGMLRPSPFPSGLIARPRSVVRDLRGVSDRPRGKAYAGVPGTALRGLAGRLRLLYGAAPLPRSARLLVHEQQVHRRLRTRGAARIAELEPAPRDLHHQVRLGPAREVLE